MKMKRFLHYWFRKNYLKGIVTLSLFFILSFNVKADYAYINVGSAQICNYSTCNNLSYSRTNISYIDYHRFYGNTPDLSGNLNYLSIYGISLTFDASKYDYMLVRAHVYNSLNNLNFNGIRFENGAFGYSLNSIYSSEIDYASDIGYTNLQHSYDNIYYVDLSTYSIGSITGYLQFYGNNVSFPGTGLNSIVLMLEPFVYLGKNGDDVSAAISNQTTSINNSITNATTGITNSVDNVNDTLSNFSVDNVDDSFTGFSQLLPTNGTITNLITLPVTLFTSILTNVNATCTTFSLGNLLNTNLTMPCINLRTVFGDTLFGIIDVLFSGFFIFTIAKKMIKVFNQFTEMKDGDVLD